MRFISSLIMATGLCLGLYLAGSQISQAGLRFQAENRSLTVKGLAEQQVQADQALWTLSFHRPGNDWPSLQQHILADRQAVLAFLKDQGFEAAELNVVPIRTTDKHTQEYGNGSEDPNRYVLTGAVGVVSSDLAKVQRALNQLDRLQGQGVVLDLSAGSASPRYALTRFSDDLRPKLLSEAAQNAQATAQLLAQQVGAKVGKLRRANQGVVQILNADDSEDSPYSSGSVEKKLRVVSTFEFELQ